MVGTLPIGILGLIFEKPLIRFCFFLITVYGQITADFVSFSVKNRLLIGFLGKLLLKSEKTKSQKWFSKIGHKMPMGRVLTKIFGVSEFFYRKFVKNNFRGRGPENRRFCAFFQKSMSEISANSEKTCFSCCRFFRKIEEMGVYFGGVRPKIFFENTY